MTMSGDGWDVLEPDEDSLSSRTLDELLGGQIAESTVRFEDDLGEENPIEGFDERQIDAAYRDLEADVHRTGGGVTSDDVHRAAARHRLSVAGLAVLELRAESTGLLPSAAAESLLGATDWAEFDAARSGSRTDALMAWFESASSVPLLDQQQEVALARRMEAGEQAAVALSRGEQDTLEVEQRLERMVERGAKARVAMTTANLRLVASIAKRYRGRGLEFLDLLQEGVLGLMRAVEKFEWRLGYKFSTYATWWIRQAVYRAIANQGRTIRLPVHIVERIAKLKRLGRELEIRLQREPTIHELAEASGVDAAEVAFFKDVERDIVSLDRPVRDDPDAATLVELVPDTGIDEFDEALETSSNESIAAEFLSMLTEREREVLIRRYGLDDGVPDTLEEIGVSWSVTRERIRQIESQALKRLSESAFASRMRGTR